MENKLVPMVLDGTDGVDVDSGNTIESPTHQATIKKRVGTAKRWCFTLNNYTVEEIQALMKIHSGPGGTDGTDFIIFGEEIGEGGTPHLQGYIEFKKRIRPKGLICDRIHWEVARGSKDRNIEYCSKEGNYYINGKKPRPAIKVTEEMLYPWQRDIYELCLTEPDDRKIYWIWEDEGCAGKSALVKLIAHKLNAIVVSNKGADMKHGVISYHEKKREWPDIVLINIPRSVDVDFISYQGIEELKDGCFFSPKYESSMVIMPSPHVIIFANKEPERDKFSADRWVVYNPRLQ